MPLLLQLNGDLPERFPTHERRLYIWACRAKSCRRRPGSVRAIRAVRVYEEVAKEILEEPKPTPKEHDRRQYLGSALFGGGTFGNGQAAGGAFDASNGARSNPFSSTNGPQTSMSNPFASAPGPVSTLAAKPLQKPPTDPSDLPATFAQKARITDTTTDSLPHPASQVPPSESVEQEAWPTDPAEQARPYPRYYLDAELEYLCPTSTTQDQAAKSTHAVFMNVDEPSDSTSKGAKTGSGKEKELPDDAIDKTFQHFADTLYQNPEQVLRYHFGGTPFLYRRGDDVSKLFVAPHEHAQSQIPRITTVKENGASASAPGPPRCPHCAGPRTFECQLTPGMISALEEEEDIATLLSEGMEWGTIILAVCEADCVEREVGLMVTQWREEWVGVQWEEVVERGGGAGDRGK